VKTMTLAVDDIYTLTPLQAGLLYHALQDPDGGIYVEQARCRLIGPLDVPRLISAWRHAVERYHALRTCMQWKGLRHPVQIVHSEADLPVIIEDWQGDDQALIEERLESWLAKDLKAGFDLTKPPLLRLALLRLASDEHMLIWTFHHLILDAWAEANILAEVVRIYETGSGTRVPAPRFCDYVRWLKTLDHTNSLQFWRDYLKDAPLQPFAKGDRRSYRTIIRHASPEVERDVRRWAANMRTTVHSVALALWALFLQARSQRRDVIFGLTVSGRPPELPGSSEQVGVLFNSVPFRVQIDDAERANELVRRVHRNYASLAPHELTPLPLIRQAVFAEREAELFDTVAVFLNFGFLIQNQKLGGCEVREVRYSSRSSYGLTFRVMERSPMSLELLYDESVLELAHAESILKGFDQALQMMASAPETSVGEVAYGLSVAMRAPQLDDASRETRLKRRLAEVRPQIKRGVQLNQGNK
jgi:Condensation domain